jgi:hypothetical protein
MAIARSENRICKCFFFYGRFRDNSADLDVTAFPANIRAEQSALPLAVKGHPTAQAGPRLVFESIAAALRTPCTGLTASSEADGAKNLSAFVADFSDECSVPLQQRAALHFSESHLNLVHPKSWGRGRDASYLTPPARIRTGRIAACGSYRGCMASKRKLG